MNVNFGLMESIKAREGKKKIGKVECKKLYCARAKELFQSWYQKNTALLQL